ncbi:MAG: DUF5340 domain-containing protein [Elainellaceae cyanobacterium]
MEQVPLPSHIHYELVLQILERQTLFAVGNKSPQRQQVLELIGTLRKALSQQKQLEESCGRARIAVDYRWSTSESSEGQPNP